MNIDDNELSFSKKDQTQFKKLIEAVLLLEKRFKKESEIRDKSKKSDEFTYKGFIKNITAGNTKKAKEMVSLRGVAGMFGVKEHTTLGSLLTVRHESKVEKQEKAKEETKKAHEFAKDFTGMTEEGRKLAAEDEEAALKRGVELYQERNELLKQELVLKDKLGRAKENLGDRDVNLNEDDLKKQREIKSRLATMFKPTPPTKVEAAQIKKEGGTVVSPTNKGKYTKKDGEWTNEIGQKIPEQYTAGLEKLLNPIQSSTAETATLTKELVDQVKGVKSNTSKVQEDKGLAEETALEGKNAKRADGTPTVDKGKNAKVENSTESLLDYVGKFKSFVTGITKGSEVLLGSVRVLGGLLANPVVLGGIGAIAAIAGTLKLINDEKVKPGEKSTLEGAASAHDASAEFQTITNANGDQTPEDIRKTQTDEQEKLKDAPWYTKLYGIGKEKYLQENKKSSPIASIPTTVEKNTDELIRARRDLEMKIEETNQAKNQPQPAQTNITSTKIDNNVSLTKVIPPVRNIEPSYNDRLQNSFAA